MTKWELAAYLSGNIIGDVTRLWIRKDKKTGKSNWDDLHDMAVEVWERVNVSQIEEAGYTKHLLYTFKRPIKDGN